MQRLCIRRVWWVLVIGFGMLMCCASVRAQLASLTVSPTSTGVVPGDFVGLSWEWGSIQKVLGQNSTGVDFIARQLIGNLAAPSPLLIRVGGNTSDESKEPQDLEPLIELANAMNAHANNLRFSLGVNMKTASPDEQKAQAQAYLGKLPAQDLDSLEVGNEPNGYAGNFTPDAYRAKAATSLGAVHSMKPTVAISGPSCSSWVQQKFLCDGPTFRNGFDLTSYLQNEKQHGLKVVTAHYYYKKAGDCAPDCLLDPAAYAVSNLFAPYINTAHKLGMKFRANEFNSLFGGGQAGVSDAFGSALWFIGNAMELAARGADGVNVHGNYLSNGGSKYDPFYIAVIPGSPNRFVLDRVSPIYYGMLFVKIATQKNREFHTVSVSDQKPCTNPGWKGEGCIQAWQSVDTSGNVRLTVLNLDEKNAGNVSVTNRSTVASVCYLSAPSVESTSHVTLAGQTFDGSTAGRIMGEPSYTVLHPDKKGQFQIPMAVTQAAIVRFGANGGC